MAQTGALTSLQLAMVAGEASGDLLASLLLQGTRAQGTHLQAWGIGGPLMQAQGFKALWPSERLAVHGYNWEVLKRIAGLLRIRKQLGNQILEKRPDLFIGVDAPDFNLGLERRLRENGVKTVHFVCPSIWAWRPERIHAIKASADHVLCLFPFEPALLAEHGIDATFVGHPLANVIPLETDTLAARHTLGLNPTAPTLALLPGSRKSEVHYLLPRFLQAAALLLQRLPNLQIVLPAAPGRRGQIDALVQAAPLAVREKLAIIDGQSHPVLQACDVTLIASGTATLEAALYKKPMVISYAMHPISAALMRRKKMQDWIGLPNILFKQFIVPELLQDEATPQALSQACLAWFDDIASESARICHLRSQFTSLHQSLQADTARAAAQAIEKVMHAPRALS